MELPEGAQIKAPGGFMSPGAFFLLSAASLTEGKNRIHARPLTVRGEGRKGERRIGQGDLKRINTHTWIQVRRETIICFRLADTPAA